MCLPPWLSRYVISTGTIHSVRELVETGAQHYQINGVLGGISGDLRQLWQLRSFLGRPAALLRLRRGHLDAVTYVKFEPANN